MDRQIVTPRAGQPAAAKKRSSRKAFWKRIRKPLAESRFAKQIISGLIKQAMRFVRLTNPLIAQSTMFDTEKYRQVEPGIVALWHGQHLMMPAFYPSKRQLVAMVSRSADAEINALVLEKFGVEVVRGSGGREEARQRDKGGARALIALKKSLAAGNNVCMIADIPHGTPRQAGQGIVLLAKLSGRPIFPAALATSRRKVIEKSWDKTTISLPFGRSGISVGEPIFVSADADDAELERKRQEVTAALNTATAEAYRLVDRR